MESTAAVPLVFSNSKSNPRNVEGIFEDFSSRRTALIRALTTDQGEFFGLCDPGNKESLCLYGHANGRWEVSPPEEMMPPDLPEPALGINLPRNKMDRADWLSLVASHSDSWLISVAFFFAAFLNAIEREINTMDTMVISLYYSLGFVIFLVPLTDQNMPYKNK